jgi:hypothetical protein
MCEHSVSCAWKVLLTAQRSAQLLPSLLSLLFSEVTCSVSLSLGPYPNFQLPCPLHFVSNFSALIFFFLTHYLTFHIVPLFILFGFLKDFFSLVFGSAGV